jgi:hypothetical protein
MEGCKGIHCNWLSTLLITGTFLLWALKEPWVASFLLPPRHGKVQRRLLDEIPRVSRDLIVSYLF